MSDKLLRCAIDYLNSIGIREVYLFGSLARKETTTYSDIDLTVRGIKPEDFFTVYGELLIRKTNSIDLIDLDIQSDFGEQLTKSGELKRIYV
ncbi:nucleotidyltransferase domain-containing protein [Thiospirochaeta perfilievii]|uniref:Nucleotidyltransferase domain-containing protein n=1 Tax=Thiospirochaeta perfilievii TaxID=252967 RepID=A0A5C1Q5X0_9SPIO|nr:nucleotidyltransferase domain-containing protein [Thiospirochaeta perfilievii]QEN03365.1 nucleotidyltransferase domain-containing protein [Thiospirochaeta perfilievii]